MEYRYYAQASVKRTFKGLTVIAEAFNEIEPADTMDGDDPAVFTSYSLTATQLPNITTPVLFGFGTTRKQVSY